MSQKFAMDYIDVATRIVEFREKHPEGSLQQVSLAFEVVDGKSYVVFTAAAYRTPEDARPGIGTAWEPIPGKTPFTRDSEVQNAETAAWGRAIVAALAADTKRGIASAEEVRNRRDAEDAPNDDSHIFAVRSVQSAWATTHGGQWDPEACASAYQRWSQGELLPNADTTKLYAFAEHVRTEEPS